MKNSCLDRIEEVFNVAELFGSGKAHIPEKEKDDTEIEFNKVTFG